MRRLLSAVAAALMLLLAVAGAAGQDAPGPLGPEEGIWRRQPWLVPLPAQDMLMRATLMRPPGPGPFPLAIINHGSSQNSLRRRRFPMPGYQVVSNWFLRRGYAVVLPLRPGHGATGGPYLEDQGRCEDPDYRASGSATADSIEATLDYMTAARFIRGGGAVVLGHSAGGWGALALASRNPKVTAIINVAGGRGGRANNVPNNNCSPERLVTIAAEFGRAARIPTLWLYAENDSFFPPALSKRMFDAFRGGGAPAAYRLLPGIAADGHDFITAEDARPLWEPIVSDFIEGLR
jgi:dienelactone hydrolase